MNSQYWLGSGRVSPPPPWRMASAVGVACMPRMVRAGSPGIRWIMKNTMIVTPMATGTSSSSRRNTKLIRPTGPHPSRVRPAWAGQARARVPGPAWPAWSTGRWSLTEPGVLEVVVAERRHEEAVHAGTRRVGVGRVVQEGQERVAGGVVLDRVVELGPGRRGQGLLGGVRVLDHRRVVVAGEERLGAGGRVDGEGDQLVRVGDVHRPVRESHVVVEVLE